LAHSVDDDIKIIRENLDKLEKALSCADENGLFKNVTDAPTYENIISNMASTYEELDKEANSKEKRMVQGWQRYRLAHHQFNQVLNSASFWWRFKYLFGGPFIIYLVVLLGLTFSAWILFGPRLSDFKVFWIPSSAYVWGLVGGILQGLWFLWQHVSDRRLRKAWFPWYLLLPFMGALLGALTYLVFFAGFIAATGGVQIQSEYFVMLLSALAGFSTRWAVETLDNVTNLIKIGK
jgi:hypothetical protein